MPTVAGLETWDVRPFRPVGRIGLWLVALRLLIATVLSGRFRHIYNHICIDRLIDKFLLLIYPNLFLDSAEAETPAKARLFWAWLFSMNIEHYEDSQATVNMTKNQTTA